MRILKTSHEYRTEEAIRALANRGCSVCPCCGESRSLVDYIQETGRLNGGVSGGLVSIECAPGFFSTKIVHKDQYRCYTCGAEWESEPY